MIHFEGKTYDFNETNRLVADYPQFEKAHEFIQRWLHGEDYFFFQSSGSTGLPKEIKINRNGITDEEISTTFGRKGSYNGGTKIW